MTTLNPGSREAKAAGCICPTIDNAGGKGYLGGIVDPKTGETLFVMSEKCPLHGTGKTEVPS